jgi:bacterioferritin
MVSGDAVVLPGPRATCSPVGKACGGWRNNMASERLKELLNKAIAREIQVSVQYMWQHVQWMGPEHFAISDKLKEIAVTEMKHAEKIAERLWYLGGVPTTKPSPITVGDEMWEMVDFDINAEVEAIELYKDIEKVADAEGDHTTRFVFESILEDEEDHHDFFTSLKEKPGKK